MIALTSPLTPSVAQTLSCNSCPFFKDIKLTLLQVSFTVPRRLHLKPIHGKLYQLRMHHWGRFSISILHSLTNLYSQVH